MEHPKMMIKKIDHISINVFDIQKSIEFYSNVLNFKQQQTVNYESFSITYFVLQDGARLELFDYHGKNEVNSREESEVGLRHLAFAVDDVAAQEVYLRSKDVEITLPTCDLPELGVRVLLFLDPNGVTLEFCEKL
jgi:catechol 2,3-dioxygenase-like lactoylglutathione lyase family enzyme